MPAILPVMLAASHLVLAAQEVPRLNIEPGCEAAATTQVTETRDKESCLKEENAARDTLKQEWDRYTSVEKTRCVELTRMGGPPSYVEVLTCLQMARDARGTKGDGFTTGMGR
jgi:hypothetical protein